jgi:hypothetical protein
MIGSVFEVKGVDIDRDRSRRLPRQGGDKLGVRR